MNNTKAFSELCLVSKHGVCLLDLSQVAEKAKEVGCNTLAEICEKDLEQNKITTGQYYPLVAALYGVEA